MTIRLVTDEKIAETAVSLFLERSNIEHDTPFTFVRYQMERLLVHGRERTGCFSENFLRSEQALITVNRLLASYLGMPLREKLASFTTAAPTEVQEENGRVLTDLLCCQIYACLL